MLFSIFFLFMTYLMLKFSNLSMFYALNGLNLWFQKMIPALLPFMILSAVAIRLNLTEKIAKIFYPFLYPVFHVRKQVIYCIFLGFLCGFPMGAKVTSDLYQLNKLTKSEAVFLLSFCNNIGPIYFCSFVLPLLNIAQPFPFLFGMYGIPLLYGVLLRYTTYKCKIPLTDNNKQIVEIDVTSYKNMLLSSIEEAIISSLKAISSLGGYMILFNLLCLPFHVIMNKPPKLIVPILEITGGLSLLGNEFPLYSLIVLSFGGLSCIAQTYSCIKDTDLNISDYVYHRLILTIITILYYFCCLLLFPALRFFLLR